MTGPDPLTVLRNDYPGWTITTRYLPSVSGPGATVYIAAGHGITASAYTISSLRAILQGYENHAPEPEGT
jgi:hypothetical protein